MNEQGCVVHLPSRLAALFIEVRCAGKREESVVMVTPDTIEAVRCKFRVYRSWLMFVHDPEATVTVTRVPIGWG